MVASTGGKFGFSLMTFWFIPQRETTFAEYGLNYIPISNTTAIPMRIAIVNYFLRSRDLLQDCCFEWNEVTIGYEWSEVTPGF